MSRRVSWLGTVGLLGGLALFVWVVYRTGPSLILDNLRQLGATFLLLLAISSVRQLLRSLAWYLCIDPAQRAIRFVDLFNIRMGGEAVTTLTFAGPLVGETAKTLVVSRHLPAGAGLSSVVAENLLYTLSVAVVIVAGALVLLFGFTLERRALVAGEVVVAGAVAAAIVLALVVGGRLRVLGFLLDRLRRIRPVWRHLESREAKILDAERSLAGFYRNDRGRFVAVFALELLSALPGILEAYIVLHVIAGRDSFLIAFVVESVYRVINTVFGFVPLRMGVDEQGTELLLAALGLAAGDGVSLAVIRKIRTLFWAGLGLFLLSKYAISADRGSDRARSDGPPPDRYRDRH